MSSSSSQQRRQHHYFLFRHCVRSTGDELKLHLLQQDDNGKGVSYGPLESIPLSSFFEPETQIPNWNVPPNACTEQALDMVEATGRWLLQSGIVDGTTIKVDFVSDTSDRDIDTAYRLSLGMQRALDDGDNDNSNNQEGLDSSPVTVIDGLNEISYFHDMFQDPFPQRLCQSRGYTNEQMENAIQERLNSIEPPTPIPEALDRMKTLLGGFSDNAQLILNHLDTSTKAATILHIDRSDNNGTSKYYSAGVVEILRTFGQFLFYSRAGGIVPVFLPDVSIPDVYSFLAFVHWSRSVFDVQTPNAAACGAVHAQIMLQALRYGSVVSTTWKNKQVMDKTPQRQISTRKDDEYDAHVTIVVGHDGDLDDLATALGIEWELPSPYISSSSSNLLPTPPLSALHLVSSFSSARKDQKTFQTTLDVSFLYPMYSNGSLWKNETSTFSGTLQSTYVTWNNEGFQSLSGPTVFSDNLESWLGAASRLQYEPGSTPSSDLVDHLQYHIESTIQRYPGAFGCWEEMGTMLRDAHASSTPFFHVGSDFGVPGLAVTVTTCLVAGIMLGCLWARKYNRKIAVTAHGMTPISQLDEFEGKSYQKRPDVENDSQSNVSTMDDAHDEFFKNRSDLELL